MLRKALCLGVGVTLLSCVAADDSQPPSLVIADSAGVRTYRVEAGTQPVTWRLSESPVLSIGGDETEESGPLFRVRAGRFLPSGGFVIANSGLSQLRFYTAAGEMRTLVGREGDGPGEFRYLGSVHLATDSVWVVDGLSSVTVVGEDGLFGRDVSLGELPYSSLPRVHGVLSDGALLVGQTPSSLMPEPGPAIHVEAIRVLRSGASVPAGEFFVAETYWQAVADGLMDTGHPFGRVGQFVSRGPHWYYTSGTEYRVEMYDGAGLLGSIFSRSEPPPAASREAFEAFLDSALAGTERPSPFETRLRRVPLPERLPAYDALLVDEPGNIWARPHGGARTSACWDIYQVVPRPEFGQACLPFAFELLDASSTQVLGVLRDSLDVERVVVYELTK
mgnify:CR=1 FL=1